MTWNFWSNDNVKIWIFDDSELSNRKKTHIDLRILRTHCATELQSKNVYLGLEKRTLCPAHDMDQLSYCRSASVVFFSLFRSKCRRKWPKREKRNCFTFVVVFAFKHFCATVHSHTPPWRVVNSKNKQRQAHFIVVGIFFSLWDRILSFLHGAVQTHSIYSYLSSWQTMKEFFPQNVSAPFSGAVFSVCWRQR